MTYFGTDGIRKEADQFTKPFLSSIVVGLADYAATIIDGRPAKVLIAGDTRESTEWILQDLSEALESLGFDYASADILPTPAINYCFYQMGFDFAIDVTASHNPYTDNGIKIFERGIDSGIKLSATGREFIETALREAKVCTFVASTDRESLHDEAVALYEEHLKDYLKTANFAGLRIGLDCANGAMSVLGGSVFRELGADVEVINCAPTFTTLINQDCGSTHLEMLKSLVRENNLDFGIAFDGDGDRTLLIDHEGNEVDGDATIAIIANYLKLDAIAVTVMANQGLLNWATTNGIKTEITSVGDSNVAESMRLHNILLGGEQSGHIILPGEPTGDGMLTSLFLTKIVAETKTPLGALAKIITKLPQVIVNLPATPAQKSALTSSAPVKSLLLEFNQKAASLDGRLLVRPSGTENLIRITVWGNDKQKITELANDLAIKLGENL